jgi:acyl-coenzyme A synthetase/AMP-(fatty) acid ligase
VGADAAARFQDAGTAVVRDALPETASGKVLRREVLADLLATELAPTP